MLFGLFGRDKGGHQTSGGKRDFSGPREVPAKIDSKELLSRILHDEKASGGLHAALDKKSTEERESVYVELAEGARKVPEMQLKECIGLALLFLRQRLERDGSDGQDTRSLLVEQITRLENELEGADHRPLLYQIDGNVHNDVRFEQAWENWAKSRSPQLKGFRFVELDDRSVSLIFEAATKSGSRFTVSLSHEFAKVTTLKEDHAAMRASEELFSMSGIKFSKGDQVLAIFAYSLGDSGRRALERSLAGEGYSQTD